MSKRRQHGGSSRTNDDSTPEPLLSPLETAIEEERSRLWRAHAVLGCLRVALLHSDEAGDCDAGHFADAADVARQLVGETVERLDSARLGPLTQRAPRTPRIARSSVRIRERPLAYAGGAYACPSLGLFCGWPSTAAVLPGSR